MPEKCALSKADPDHCAQSRALYPVNQAILSHLGLTATFFTLVLRVYDSFGKFSSR